MSDVPDSVSGFQAPVSRLLGSVEQGVTDVNSPSSRPARLVGLWSRDPPQSDTDTASHLSSSPEDSQGAFHPDLTFTGRINDDVEVFNEADFLLGEDEDDEIFRTAMKRQMQELDICSTIEEESQDEYLSTASGVTTEDESGPNAKVPPGDGSVLQAVAGHQSSSSSRTRHAELGCVESSSAESSEDEGAEAMGDIFAQEHSSTRPGTPGTSMKRKSLSDILNGSYDASDDDDPPRVKLPRLEPPYMAELKDFLRGKDPGSHHAEKLFQDRQLDERKVVVPDCVILEPRTSQTPGTDVLDTQSVKSPPSGTHSATTSSHSTESMHREPLPELLDVPDFSVNGNATEAPGNRFPRTDVVVRNDISLPDTIVDVEFPSVLLSQNSVARDTMPVFPYSGNGIADTLSAYDADPEDTVEPDATSRKKKRKRTLKDEDRKMIRQVLESLKAATEKSCPGLVDSRSSAATFETDKSPKSARTEQKLHAAASLNPDKSDSVFKRLKDRTPDSGDGSTFAAHKADSQGAENPLDFRFEGDGAQLWSRAVEPHFGNSSDHDALSEERSGRLRKVARKSRSQLNLVKEREVDLEREFESDIGSLKRSPGLSPSHFDWSKEGVAEMGLGKKLSVSKVDISREKEIDLELLDWQRRSTQGDLQVGEQAGIHSIDKSRTPLISRLQMQKPLQVDLDSHSDHILRPMSLDRCFSDVQNATCGWFGSDQSDHRAVSRTLSTEYINLIHIDNINHIDPSQSSSNMASLDSSQITGGAGRGGLRERFSAFGLRHGLSYSLAGELSTRPQSFERTRSLSSGRRSSSFTNVTSQRSRSHDLDERNGHRSLSAFSAGIVNEVDLSELGRRKQSRFSPVAFRFDLSDLLDSGVENSKQKATGMVRRHSVDAPRRATSLETASGKSRSLSFLNSVHLVGAETEMYSPVEFRFDLSSLAGQGQERKGEGQRSARVKPAKFAQEEWPSAAHRKHSPGKDSTPRAWSGSLDQTPQSVKRQHPRTVEKHNRNVFGSITYPGAKSKTGVTLAAVSDSRTGQESENTTPFRHLRRFWETGRWESADLDISVAGALHDSSSRSDSGSKTSPRFRQDTGNLVLRGGKPKRRRHSTDSDRVLRVRKISVESPLESTPLKFTEFIETPSFIEIQSSKAETLVINKETQSDTWQKSSLWHPGSPAAQLSARVSRTGLQFSGTDLMGSAGSLSPYSLHLSPSATLASRDSSEENTD